MSTQNANDDEMYETQSMGVNEAIIGEFLIFDQAENIVDGWREGVQNAGDAPGSTEVNVVVQPEQGRSIIWDNGDGMDLGDGEMRKFIEILGESTKRDDPESVGQFGVGFAQMMAKGVVTVKTQDWEVRWDAKTEPAMSYEIRQTDDEFSGFWIEIDHYESENPDPDDTEWENMVSELKTRFQFFELVKDVQVTVNGERISDKTPADQYRGEAVIQQETDTAVYALGTKNMDKVKAYSAGLEVGWKNANGLYGYVVTKENCALNLSRDKIKSGCDVWSQVEDELADFRIEVLKATSDEQITEAGRKAMVNLMRDDPVANGNRFRDREMFKMANGRTISYTDLNDKTQVSIASKNDPNADKLIEMGHTVLREEDAAVEELTKGAENGELSMPETKDFKEVADSAGITFELEVVDDMTEWPQTKMALARILSNKMESKMGEMSRDIVYGQDDGANAWTQGRGTFVALTDTAMEGRRWKVFMPQLWRILCHEYAHQDDDTGNMNHSEKFNETFRNYVDRTESCLVELIEEIEEDGLWDTIRASRVDHSQFSD